MTALAPVAAVLERGRAEGIAPALAAAVLSDGQVVHASAHGALADPARALADGDVFDVASLTKVMATATIAAQLAAEGRLRLDVPVAELLPAFAAGGKERVTARHLLAHAGGLPAWRPYCERAAADAGAAPMFAPPGRRPPLAALAGAFARGRSLVTDAVLAEPAEVAPGTRALYCDPGFIALGLLVERLGGAPLPRLFAARVAGPLALRSTFFVDGLEPAAAEAARARRAFPPTGWSARRGEVVTGFVNDDNAWAMGGAAGHAGLFSTAAEVAALGQAWLEAATGRGGVVPADAAREFARRDATPGSDRALGWDTPSRGASSLGSRLGRGPRGAIGHLGFTGTSLWIDLDGGIVCALLTNHVHPSGTSDRPRMRAFRQAFHDAVAEGLGIG